MKRYNLALLPLTIGPQALSLSHEFSHLSDNYLLGKASHPHVTVCQFYAFDHQLAGLWETAGRLFTEKSLRLDFNRATTFVNIEKLWVQLIPEPHVGLHHLHRQLAEVVKEPLGLVLEKYSPHLTLANIKKDLWEKARAQVAAMQVKLVDDFVLALGHCDEMGQFTEILYRSS